MLTYIAVNAVSRMLFKKDKSTPEPKQSVRFGVMGALLGFVFAMFLFVVSYYAVRMMGTIAASKVQSVNAELEASKHQPKTAHAYAPQEDPPAFIKGLAKLNGALNEGQTGEFFHKVDRVPPNVYAMLFKLGIMVSSEESLDRFLGYPGVAALARHPKLAILKSDAAVPNSSRVRATSNCCVTKRSSPSRTTKSSHRRSKRWTSRKRSTMPSKVALLPRSAVPLRSFTPLSSMA